MRCGTKSTCAGVEVVSVGGVGGKASLEMGWGRVRDGLGTGWGLGGDY